MATAVWTYECAHNGFSAKRKTDHVVIPLGDGKFRTGMKSQAWSHQDGTGGADTSYRGTHVFTWTLPILDYATNTAARSYTGALVFLQARKDGGFESFYIYDPVVQPLSANWDGVETVGRHLVKCFEIPDRNGLQYQDAQYAAIQFHEVQL